MRVADVIEPRLGRRALVLGVVLLLGCSGGEGRGRPSGAPADSEDLRSAAEAVVRALAGEDFEALAEWVDPEEGVLFAPYAYVEPGQHVMLSAEELREVARGEPIERTWGAYDGTGEPIRLGFGEYFDRFVYDRPYLEEAQVAVDRRQGHGNTLDNAAEVWPEARIVEYHLPGDDPRYGGMDWRSLRLVFEDEDGRWRLVAIVHDEWTI